MSPRSPQGAPPRPDLTFLRHRARPAPVPPSPALADYLSGHDPRRPRHAPSASSSLDLSGSAAPVVSSSLDLSGPVAPVVSSSLDLSGPVAPVVSSSLDLSGPVAPVVSSSLDLSGPVAPVVSSSLDLSGPVAPVVSSSLDLSPAPSPVRPAAPRPAPSAAAYAPPRARSKATTILKPAAPTVTLTRVQSGVGALVLEAACSPAVGDLRLGVAYELTGGESSIVQHSSGLLVAPPGSRRPLVAGQRAQFERVTLDLAQVRRLRRLMLYAFSESDSALQWGGTLVVTTLGQARLDLALDRPPSPGVAVLLTIFAIDGELVIRAESDLIAGSVRDACLAYGFDRITWLDGRTPLA